MKASVVISKEEQVYRMPLVARGLVVVLAIGLIWGTLHWHIPMMLWDHLDLPPMYRAWNEGHLGGALWKIHDGSHWHAVAYAVLLATTYLSGGQPWLDCLISVVLLLAMAAVVLHQTRQTLLPARAHATGLLLIVFLALYPGHLANLQWGWQIAVFICLLGAVVAMHYLAAPRLDGLGNALALLAAVVACLSFTAGIALLPVALFLIGSRTDLTASRRASLLVPWIALGAAGVWALVQPSNMGGASWNTWSLALYALNFLGGAVLRFATDLAAVAAVFGLVTGTLAFLSVRKHAASRFWLGCFLFGAGCAVLTAVGRAPAYGAEHAFATRYVSFAALFWLGWAGLLLLALPHWSQRRQMKFARAALAVVLALSVANAAHVTKKVARLAGQSREIAARIVATYPHVDEQLLRDIYFTRVDAARERLATLKAYGFAPFASAAQPSGEPGQPQPSSERVRAAGSLPAGEAAR
jgi:hypothetical protein